MGANTTILLLILFLIKLIDDGDWIEDLAESFVSLVSKIVKFFSINIFRKIDKQKIKEKMKTEYIEKHFNHNKKVWELREEIEELERELEGKRNGKK